MGKETSTSNEVLVAQYQAAADEDQKSKILETLYWNNIHVIKGIAFKFRTMGEPEDLTQEAFFSVRAAAEGYKDCGYTFLSYLRKILKCKFFDYCVKANSYIAVPPNLKLEAGKAVKSISDLEKELGRTPTNDEVRIITGLSQEQVFRFKKINESRCRHLEDVVHGTDRLCLKDVIQDPDNQYDSIEHEYDNAILAREISMALDKLSPVQALVIKNKFYNNKSLKEISVELGVPYHIVTTNNKRAMYLLKRNARLRRVCSEYFDDLASSIGYKGSFKSFVGSGMSPQERIAIKLEEAEAKLKKKA